MLPELVTPELTVLELVMPEDVVLVMVMLLFAVLAVAWASWVAPRGAAAARRGRASQATARHADFVHLRTAGVSSFRGDQRRALRAVRGCGH
jgi:hypothetical protein